MPITLTLKIICLSTKTALKVFKIALKVFKNNIYIIIFVKNFFLIPKKGGFSFIKVSLMQKIVLYTLVVALLFLIGCSTQVDNSYSGRIQGIVTDSLSTPIPDVTISASGKDETTVTDLNGEFALDSIPTGEVAIIATKHSYQSAMSVVNIPVGVVKSSVNFVLRKE